jgi:hypothetical protein
MTIPDGYCQCGCGERTTVSVQNHARHGWVRGQPLRYVRGHNNRGRHLYDGPRYLIEDRGYDTPCWIWQMFRNHDGYGQVTVGGINQPAHRVYYEARFGPAPDRLHLDHLCRVSACVNPEHLEPVTTAENTRRGLSAKLTAEAVREIRRRLADGARGVDLAAEFGVSSPTISEIKHRRKWADLT